MTDCTVPAQLVSSRRCGADNGTVLCTVGPVRSASAGGCRFKRLPASNRRPGTPQRRRWGGAGEGRGGAGRLGGHAEEVVGLPRVALYAPAVQVHHPKVEPRLRAALRVPRGPRDTTAHVRSTGSPRPTSDDSRVPSHQGLAFKPGMRGARRGAHTAVSSMPAWAAVSQPLCMRSRLILPEVPPSMV